MTIKQQSFANSLVVQLLMQIRFIFRPVSWLALNLPVRGQTSNVAPRTIRWRGWPASGLSFTTRLPLVAPKVMLMIVVVVMLP